MIDYYTTLGINSSATPDEIRRAYRILARRHHPDVNPGKNSEERFKMISEAYTTLIDAARKRSYDAELQQKQKKAEEEETSRFWDAQNRRFHHAGKAAQDRLRNQARSAEASQRRAAAPQERSQPINLGAAFKTVKNSVSGLFRGSPPAAHKNSAQRPSGGGEALATPISKISLIEVSVTIRDAILGVKKTVEIDDERGQRKVSVNLPPGVRSGSVIRLRNKNESSEELVLVVKVAQHPFMSVEARGLVIDLPVTIGEAVTGASITVPTLEEPQQIKIPPGSSSGSEIRIPERGIMLKEGRRGDLFYRLMIKTPESPEAPGLREVVREVERYYGQRVRTEKTQFSHDIDSN